MNQYYLMAQLPSLDAISDGMPLPITEERFTELCNRFLGKRAAIVLNNLTAAPDRDAPPSGDALVDRWNNREIQLRLALAAARAKKMGKEFDTGSTPIPGELTVIAQEASAMTDPMAAELFLLRHRLSFLESLKPADPFSQSSVYYYGLRLKLMSRIRGFDADRGEQEYRNIYSSILHGAEQETIQ